MRMYFLQSKKNVTLIALCTNNMENVTVWINNVSVVVCANNVMGVLVWTNNVENTSSDKFD